MIYETETDLPVRPRGAGPDGERRLELNEGQAVHSVYRPGRYLTGDYWDEFLVAPAHRRRTATAAARDPRQRRRHHRPRLRPLLPRHPRRRGRDRRRADRGRPPLLRPARARACGSITADARPFLRSTDRRYDAILVDAYRQPYIPFYLATREFFALARSRLTPGGASSSTSATPKGRRRSSRCSAATMRAVFPAVSRDPVKPTNTLLIAGGVASPARLARAASTLPATLRPLASAVARRLAPSLRGGTVYTDDRAPVEWLIDRSIIQYASRDR